MQKDVMCRAWIIARNGQQKHGGNAKEYISAALKLSWSITKKQNAMKNNSLKKEGVGIVLAFQHSFKKVKSFLKRLVKRLAKKDNLHYNKSIRKRRESD